MPSACDRIRGSLTCIMMHKIRNFKYYFYFPLGKFGEDYAD